VSRGEGSSAAEGEEHPAAAAWRSLGPDRRVPSGVEKVRAKKPPGRCVYRLLHATADGDSVIAKRYGVAAHSIERALYQEVLPSLPVSSLRFYGEIDADDGYVWIFLEDAGRQKFSPCDAEHRALAARWLGAMHVAASALPFRDRLPDRGLQHYRRHLETGRRLILDNLDNPGLRTDEIVLLRSVVALCNAVERRWVELQDICAAAPATLVHGDFEPRNVFVRDAPGGPDWQRLLVIDWETSGWAVPAADLAPPRQQSQVDLEIYCRIMQERWSDFDLRMARRLMWVGLIFRRLAAIEWAAVRLVDPGPVALEQPLARLRIYHEELGRALEHGLSAVHA
jgi:Phosphotransferase enzyme family